MGNQQSSVLNNGGFFHGKKKIDNEINLIKDNKGLYYIRTSDERNMMLLYIHIYYDNFAMDRKRNYLVQRFREHNGRN